VLTNVRVCHENQKLVTPISCPLMKKHLSTQFIPLIELKTTRAPAAI